MIIVKNSEQLALMKKAGRITAEALLVARDMIRPGISTKEIDTKIRSFIEKCGGELMIRSDDAPEVVRSRLEVYHTTTEPLYDYYVSKGNLVHVDGMGSVGETIARTFRALGVE